MKIISWNCGGKFREKLKYIKKYKADIYVIQECENPSQCQDATYRAFAENYSWIGENKNKGLGIFARKNIVMRRNTWEAYCLRFFMSVNINNKFDLLGVWACRPYIEEYYIYQEINFSHFNNHTVIIGDFNSNAKWDKKCGNRCHSAVVSKLRDINLVSAYHYMFHEQQGAESQPTFYLYRHLDKGYHTDHCFADKNTIKDYQILFEEKCLQLSDHIPLCIYL